MTATTSIRLLIRVLLFLINFYRFIKFNENIDPRFIHHHHRNAGNRKKKKKKEKKRKKKKERKKRKPLSSSSTKDLLGLGLSST